MVKSILVFVVTLVAFCFPATLSAAPLEAYGRLPAIQDIAISADGDVIAVLWTNGTERRITINDLKSDEINTLGLGPAKIRDIVWADSQHLLITSSTTATIPWVEAPRSEYALLYLYDRKINKIKSLMKDSGEGLNIIIGLPDIRTVAGKATVFVQGIHFVSNFGQVSVFKIDPQTGRSTLVDAGERGTIDWLISADGRPVAQTVYNSKVSQWTLKIAKGPGWRVVKSLEAPIERPAILGLGRDGRSVLVGEGVEDGVALREIDPDDPVWPEPFRTDPEGSTLHDRATHRLIGFQHYSADQTAYEFFDPSDQEAWAKIQRAYKGIEVSLNSWSDNRRRIVITVDSPTDGPSFALVDLDAKRSDSLGDFYQDLTPDDIAEVKAVSFKAKDGLSLSGYLTLPRGRPAKNLSLVVLPHGGPASRDFGDFDWWSQALASRGYAVLRVNYRGSAGFGADHLEAGYGQWGRKMQTDLSDGVRELARQGTIDPARVCIVGASYGGYAALAGAAFDPGVYRCAVSVAGPSDLGKMVNWTLGNRGPVAQRYWIRFMGAKGPKDPVLDTLSPALHADKISIPVLLIHGSNDTVVSPIQSQVMERALRSAGKSVELVTLQSEDHWLSQGETRLQMLSATVTFLEKYNPAQ